MKGGQEREKKVRIFAVKEQRTRNGGPRRCGDQDVLLWHTEKIT